MAQALGTGEFKENGLLNVDSGIGSRDIPPSELLAEPRENRGAGLGESGVVSSVRALSA